MTAVSSWQFAGGLSSVELRQVSLHHAACEASRLAGAVLDALLEGVAAGTPPTSEEWGEAERRWVEARAAERSTFEAIVHVPARHHEPIAVARPSPVPPPEPSRAPVTQRSPRFAPRRGPASRRESISPR